VTWEARTALAFVNGTSASLARAMVNHVRLAALARAAAAATGRLAFLLGCDPAPYDDRLAMLRGHPGHRTASAWIRAEAGGGVNPAHGDPEGSPHDGQAGRPFQEPYSLRCAPQILGAVLDQLRSQEEVLAIEATGCTDNPVTFGDDVLHGGNFHAAPVALAVDQQTVCTHQVAFLLERQLALIVDPLRNGGLPPLLARRPGRTSGLAGVQMAASSLLAAIRQHAYPASCTPVPSNLGNQDHVPMALNGANAVAEMLDRAWLIAASVFHALAQVQLLQHRPIADGGLWGDLARHAPDLSRDRPMAAPVAALAARLEAEFTPCRPDLRGEMA
jgi:histidine ammonia-lyase